MYVLVYELKCYRSSCDSGGTFEKEPCINSQGGTLIIPNLLSQVQICPGPFGSAILINKPGLSLVRKARLAHRSTAFHSVSLCQRGQAARWHRVLGVSLRNVREYPSLQGDCTRAIFFPWCWRKQTNAESRRSEKSVVQPKAAW